MENILKLKAKAFDARIKLDQLESQIQQFTKEQVVPARTEYEKTVNELAQALQEEQKANSVQGE